MRFFKKAYSIVTTVLVIVVACFALALVVCRFSGIKLFSVLSGSMEPQYHVGSLIFVKKVDTDTLVEGDIITFVLQDEKIATHRIVGVADDHRYFRTQGDANEHPDANSVYYENIVGVPFFTIPKLGYIINFIQRPPGMYIAIAGCALLLLLVFLPDLLSSDDEPIVIKENDKKRFN